MLFQFTPLREGRRQSRHSACPTWIYFNSRPSARGDVKAFLDGGSVRLFQFTPLREGRLCGTSRVRAVIHFNSRPSARGDPCVGRSCSSHLYFNSRPSARGDADKGVAFALGHDFNSRPSARGDQPAASRAASGQQISIHAPPRGATVQLTVVYRREKFQFTPLREGRLDAPTGDAIHIDFNSRPSARGDASGQQSRQRPADFNSRPSARGDVSRKLNAHTE